MIIVYIFMSMHRCIALEYDLGSNGIKFSPRLSLLSLMSLSQLYVNVGPPIDVSSI